MSLERKTEGRDRLYGALQVTVKILEDRHYVTWFLPGSFWLLYWGQTPGGKEWMEAGSSGEAAAVVQVENDGGGASKWLFILFYSHSRQYRFNIIIWWMAHIKIYIKKTKLESNQGSHTAFDFPPLSWFGIFRVQARCFVACLTFWMSDCFFIGSVSLFFFFFGKTTGVVLCLPHCIIWGDT